MNPSTTHGDGSEYQHAVGDVHEHHEPHHHNHHHHHHHGPESDLSLAEVNAQYFDQEADKYENMPGVRELLQQIGNALRKDYTFDKSTTTVLDFACGIGMVSRELAPHVKSIIGVDVSKRSVEIYNSRAASMEQSCEMRALSVELKGEPGELDDAKFDVVVCSMAYHHFESPENMTRILAHFLKPGGKLVVVDLIAGGPVIAGGDLRAIVPTPHGFSEADIKAMFEGAGLTGVKFRKAFRAPMPMKAELPEEDRMADIFLADGTKSTDDALKL